MSIPNREAHAHIQSALSLLPMVDPNELGPLAQITGVLETLAHLGSIPRALQTQAARSAKLCEQIVMGETDFASGLHKLAQSLSKMGRSLEQDSSPEGAANSEADEAPLSPSTPTPAAPRVSSENRELVAAFADRMVSALEDFEAAVLELEKGDSQARGALNRMLHTWKGEFGVLDIPSYAELMHRVEEAVAAERYDTEAFFSLKDFLALRAGELAAGRVPLITEADFEVLGCGNDHSPAPELLQTEPAPAVPPVQGTERSGRTPREAVSPGPVASGEQPGAFHFEGDPSLMADFITESRDHIHTAESILLDLETDPANLEHLNSIFRCCHTIKGVAGFLDLKDIGSLAHSMENLMDMARKGDVALGTAHLDLLFEAMDVLKEFIGALESALSGGEYHVPPIWESVMARLTSPLALTASAPARPQKEEKVGRILVEQGVVSPADIEEATRRQSQGDPRRIGEILIEENKATPRAVGAALGTQTAAQKGAGVEETVRVPVERLDQLIDAIGEAVIAQSMVSADPVIRASRNQQLERKIAQIDLIMRQIQELSMALRMISIKSTFQKMARLVRDLAKKTGKQVNLVMDGEDTELDKTVVENIGDPLMHMIRNAVDHGIEEPRERAASGKPEVATVTLRAFHKAGNVVVEISDDGRGLDRDAILNKGVEKGIARANENYTDQEIFNFIFLPGFSTAKKVTDVSGRGVGMDVVRKNIQALRGSVEIASEKGKGSTFTIRLPLTLAIINGMVVRLGRERYIVPTLSIIDSLRPEPGQVQTITGKGEMLNVRGDLMNFARLADLFGAGKGVRAPIDEGIALVVEDMLGKRMGLFVDEILDQQQVVIKSLGEGIGDVPGVTGGAIMSDGSVSLILDIAALMRLSDQAG